MKLTVRKTMQYFADILISLSIFLLILSFLPIQNKTNSSQKTIIVKDNYPNNDMKFVFHASADQREMFFAENELDDVLSGDLKDELIEYLDKEFSSNTGINNIVENSGLILKDCELPWGGDKIKNGESVLAYQQRTDSPSICNVEKRTCKNGILDGTYSERSCREIIKYNYQKEEVISYNERPINLYIQAPKYADHRNEEFSMNGKVNEKLIAIDYRDNDINTSLVSEKPDIGQVIINKKDCITPRGETVKHTQFVKAYRSSLGFTNNPCDVELRMCLDGELEGTYKYPYCEYKEQPDEIYLMDKLKENPEKKEKFNPRTLVQGIFD